MASPYILTNHDLSYLNSTRQSWRVYVAFLNPVSYTTTWSDLNEDAQGNWLAPPNVDTAALKIAPYAPTCNMGGNRIGFANEPLYFDGSRSCQRHDLPVVSYTWSATGSPTITHYAQGSQVGIAWSSPGIYTVSLTVTDRAGTPTTGIRQVMVYQDRDHALPGVISLSGLAGSLSSGGWQCQITTVSSQVTLQPPETLPTGTYQPLVLMIETGYEIFPGTIVWRTLGPHGQFNPGYPYQDPRMFFDGYVVNGTVHQDAEKDTLSFSCSGIQMILQESHAHQVGYYNTTYKGFTSNQVPTGCNNSPVGQGYLVGNLLASDVIHSLLQTHSTITMRHDLHIWNAVYPTSVYQPGNPLAYYQPIYTTLSLNEGTLWSNIADVASNDWSEVVCGQDGSIRIGPQINYRGSDFWSQPTLLGQTTASLFLNVLADLGYSVPGDLTTVGQNIPLVPAQPMPVQFVHPWSHQPNPPQHSFPFQPFLDPEVILKQQVLNGPPILCTFSDVPEYDTGTTPVQGLYPYVTWPQDLSVYFVSLELPQAYSGHTALVKLIGTLYGHSTLWTCWYPQDAFKVAPDGTSTIVNSKLPTGNWVVDENHLLPDVTTKQNGLFVSNYWWELARRHYYALNNRYNGVSVTLGMFTAAQLGDIVGITRQNTTLGPRWRQKPFYVTDISHNIDLSNATWSTQLQVSEVSSILLSPIQPPPKIVPKR